MNMKVIQIFFTIAALWNITGAGGALLFPEFHTQLFFELSNSKFDIVAHVNTQAFWVSVLFFGVGYAIVAYNPRKNHGILLIAILGKLYVAVLWSYYWWNGKIKFFGLVGAVGDFVFALLFIAFLLWFWQRSKNND
ncbi:hypothetical protein [Candidatus Uabimicrobium sp. HlEnr_7]|uniref:hypothetical protein n=1 Tax=Candidatus Uabimicrobium helgolandensis TaxID=3095367 RepID=UPI00355627A8